MRDVEGEPPAEGWSKAPPPPSRQHGREARGTGPREYHLQQAGAETTLSFSLVHSSAQSRRHKYLWDKG